MSTAHRASVNRRIRFSALAMLLAATLLMPFGQPVFADVGDDEVAAGGSGGLSISVSSADQLTGLTAIVVAPDGAPLLTEADPSADILATVPDGSEVNLRVDTVDTVSASNGDRFWPVTVEGEDGWMSGSQLAQATTPDGTIVSTTVVPFEYTRTATADSTAKVFGGGQNVNVRSEPDPASDVVTKAADGDVISLRIDLVDTEVDDSGVRWWPVTVNGIDGWISGLYLLDSGDAPTSRAADGPVPTVPATDATATATSDPPATVPATGNTFAPGSFAQVFTGNGDSVNVRESGAADAAITGSLADGAIVQIVSGPVDVDGSTAGFYEVTNANVDGWVDGDFLITSVEAAATQQSTVTSTEPPRSEGEEATAAVTETPRATEAPATETPATQPPSSSAQFIYPLADYTETQQFGCSNLGFYSYNAEYGCALHNGLDMAAPSGSDIMAAGSGTVVTAGWCNCGLGYYVEIDHGNGIHTLYGHMASQPYVSAGETVNQGDVIGPVGSTGISTGPHVHFMVTVNGKATDPKKYL